MVRPKLGYRAGTPRLMRLWQKRADGQGDLYRVNRRV